MTSLRLVLAAALVLSACSTAEEGRGNPGDGTSEATPTDAGAGTAAERDASAPATADASPGDAGSEAGSGTCDLAKPFAKYTTLAEAGSLEFIDFARVTADEKTLYTVRTRGNVPRAYFATRASASVPFGAETPVSYAQNPGARAMWAPDDGNRLYISANSASLNYLRIYELTRPAPGTPYATPPVLVPLVDDSDKFHLFHLFVTSGNNIYVTRNSEASSITRIYRSPLASPSLEPVPELDGNGNGEASPLLTADERTIYFASRRSPSPSPGWELLFQADRATSTGTFSNVRNVDTAFLDDNPNTYSRRVLPVGISSDRCRLYVLQVRDQVADRVVVLTR